MTQSPTYRDNNTIGAANGHGNNNTNDLELAPNNNRTGTTDESYSQSSSLMRTENYQRPSFCQRCCTFQNFCYVVQFVNCGLVCALIYLAVQEYPKIEALQAQVEEDKAEIAALTEEVREKQEGQIQSLNKAVKQEQQFNFLTLAGTFTLITCLISMFHMSTHVHKFNQPQIQRKIIAILWMSPIYSVTSFLTLIFPSVEGWMAIIKDFYEAYCIYVFLSFLIAVLGQGSRDKAVEVLAKHADHLSRPTRCLSCLYEPPPDTSDHAKANAVMTQCQIYCLQFTLIRPLTTIISVFVLHRNKNEEEGEGDDEDINTADESNGDSIEEDSNDDSITIVNSSEKNITDFQSSESSSIETTVGAEPNAASSSPEFGGAAATISPTSDETSQGGERRALRDVQNKRQGTKRSLLYEVASEEEGTTPMESTESNGVANDAYSTGFPSMVPIVGDGDNGFSTLYPTVVQEGLPLGSIDTFPSLPPNAMDALPTLSPIAGVIPAPENNSPAFNYENNQTGYDGTNSSWKYPTLPPVLSIGSNETNFESSEIVVQTKAYFQSPRFVLAMIVNVSIFIAFTGLLKLYHAVREDLLWCKPFPKFLTIKAVVFVTFWQGLAIMLYLVLTADPDEREEAFQEARKYQNLLICVEMLLVAISQWCVFPAIEWEPNYVPREMHTPGLGIKDFVTDVGQIVKRSGRRRKGRRSARRKKRGNSSNNLPGLYHMPGFASTVSSPYDGVGGSAGDDEFENSSFDSSICDERDQFTIDDENDVNCRTPGSNGIHRHHNERPTNGLSIPSSPQGDRGRIRLDSADSAYSLENDEIL